MDGCAAEADASAAAAAAAASAGAHCAPDMCAVGLGGAPAAAAAASPHMLATPFGCNSALSPLGFGGQDQPLHSPGATPVYSPFPPSATSTSPSGAGISSSARVRQSPGDRHADYKNNSREPARMRTKRRAEHRSLLQSRRDEMFRRSRRPAQSGSEGEPTGVAGGLQAHGERRPAGLASLDPALLQLLAGIRAPSPTPEELAQALANDGDPGGQQQALQSYRRLLMSGNPAVVRAIIGSGVLPKLVELLDSPHQALRTDAMWIVSSLTAGETEDTCHVLHAGALEPIFRLLESPSEAAREQAVWAIANIAGDSPETRRAVLAVGGIPAIANVIAREAIPKIMRLAAWALANLCRDLEDMSVLPLLVGVLDIQDEEVLIEAALALSFLTDGGNCDRIQAVLESGIAGRLAGLLGCPNPNVQVPVVRSLGNLVMGADEQTQVVVDLGVLVTFRELLATPHDELQKEVLWAISNVTAGNAAQIQAVIDAGLVPSLVNIAANGNFKSRRESAWSIVNILNSCVPAQVDYVLQMNCLPPLLNILPLMDPRTPVFILNALEVAFEHGARAGGSNPFVEQVEELNGMEMIENLQYSENPQVAARASRLVDRFFADSF